MTEANKPFRIEVTIAAPVDEVWRSLRDPDLIRRWHGWDFEDPNGGLDAEIDFIYRQHATPDEAEHTLALGDGSTFTLHDAGAGATMIRLVRSPRDDNSEWADYWEDINEGWVTFLHQLRFALERHPGAERRTLFFSGQPGPAGEPRAALGLDRLAGLAPGEPYSAELVGAPAAGQVWFHSARQIGLSVDSWGDGLMIVGTAPPSPVRPNPQAMAVLTTYALADKEFDDLRDRWTRWWEQTFTS
ncbi:MAG TPA: SRPBCC domain-containing protein [Actinophytocola sp.]|uniref:SRPBCC family protein n=1 Tax=Actinophytocola sp. TaxID=1872138 RepID=UPI002DB5810F|nr:SRPBCC domain-containing protein [Actinophytocola sp.]HEU5471066.1 SRPBCC domain-containing protein [Actinophytocola sp.]